MGLSSGLSRYTQGITPSITRQLQLASKKQGEMDTHERFDVSVKRGLLKTYL